MDKALHQQLYSGMSRHSLGGAALRTRQSPASSFGSSTGAGRKSLGGSSVLGYGGGGGGGLKKSAANAGGMGQR